MLYLLVGKINKIILFSGAVIYLLDLFCNCKIPETREAAVEIMARMMADKLHGPKVKILQYFLM